MSPVVAEVIFAAGLETSAFDSVNINFGENLVTMCSSSQGMEIERNENKRLTNLRKSGIYFFEISLLFAGDIAVPTVMRYVFGVRASCSLLSIASKMLALL
ncbi:BrnT family toxin [Laspinema sp. D1]|uniref:BrnT family toxin n=1 Tax=Laspinema palackyanum D2a TaxID=2953684 RepID=A0ABT2N384_9CYAN|nr:BrnT family toxin [Laspinema sp. D2a]